MNGPESLIKVYKDAHALSITALVEKIFYKTMLWFADRRELATTNLAEGKQWSSYGSAKIENKIYKSQTMKIKIVSVSLYMYEVEAKKGKHHNQQWFKSKFSRLTNQHARVKNLIW
jgi:hypothetical protein